MSEPYTPTTGMVAAAYVIDRTGAGRAKRPVSDAAITAAEAEFDRWLAQHDREVAARALRDAAGALVDANPGGDAFQHAVAYRVARDLHQRAEHIARGEGV